MNNLKLISIIIPFFSGREWLDKALESVFNQTYKNIEVILINDGSKENIDDLLKKYSSIKYFKIENNGPAFARNLGIEKSSGDYISFLDADDLWLQNKIEKQVNFLISTNYAWGATGYQLFEDKTNKYLSIKNEGVSGNVFQKSLFSCNIATPTVMIETKVLKTNKQLRFIEETRFGEDTLFWLNILSIYPVGYLNEILTLVRIRENNAAKMVNIQLSARAYIYEYLRNKGFVLNERKIPNSARFIYYLSFVFNKLNPRKNEWIAKILYLPIWLLFKFFFKLSK